MTNRRTSAPATAANPRYPYPESPDRDFAFDIDYKGYDEDDSRDAARLGRAGRYEHQQPTAGAYPEYGGNNNNNSRSDSVDDNDDDALLEASHDGEGLANGVDDNNNEDEDSWRKPGRQFRSNLMRLDAKNSFQLKPECAIERYYQVADRVMEQFLHHPIDDRDEIIEAYLIGSRLVHFLSSILPTHPEYFAPEPTLAKLRNRAQSQLSELTGYAEVLAIMLDKQEHERYVSRVLLREDSIREAAAATDDADDYDYDEGFNRNPNELEGGDQYGEVLDLDGDEGESFGDRPPAPDADHPNQRKAHGRHSRPPLAARNSSANSSSSNAVPTFEIDVRRRRNGNLTGTGGNKGSRSRSAGGDSLIGQRPPEVDDRSASQDSARPLLLDDSQPRSHYRFGQGSDKGDDDWDVAWVRRHGRMHAVLDQESSVATGDSSNVERSTVDSSLMNPPEPRYSPLVSAANTSPSRRRRDVISTSQANRAALRAPPSPAATRERAVPRRDDSPQAAPFMKQEESHELESQRRYPKNHDDKDPSFLREGSAAGKQRQTLDRDNHNSGHGVRNEFSAPGREASASGWDQFAVDAPSSTARLAVMEPSTDGPSSTRNHPRTSTGRFPKSTEERKKDSPTGRPSPARDVLEDPENRWFGDDDTASVATNKHDAGGDFRSQDPYDERLLPDLQYDDRRYRPPFESASESHPEAISSKPLYSMSKPDIRRDQDVASHHSNRRYVPGSIRERAALRRQSSDTSQPRFDQEPANDWVDFGKFDADSNYRAKSTPVSLEAAFESEIASEGTQHRQDPFDNHVSPTSSLATSVKTTRESLVDAESTRLSRSVTDLETSPKPDSNRRLFGMQGLSSCEERVFKVNVTVDGKECVGPSDSFPLQTNESIPNHRLSSVRASAERLKELKSRRLEFRARTLDEYRVDEIPNDELPMYESPNADRMLKDALSSEDKTEKESIAEAETVRVEERSADVENKSQLDLNTSIENDSVLNGEVEQILTRESSMMRSKYESFNTSGSMNEGTSAESNTGALSESFDCSDDRCEGDDEASRVSTFDPFVDEDSSAQRDLVETRKRQDVLIEAMRLEQRTFLNASPPRIRERSKLIPSSRDTYYASKRKPLVSVATEHPADQDRRTGPVDLDATVDEDDESDRDDKEGEVGDAVQDSTSHPTAEGRDSTSVASPVGNRTRIEERMQEARRSKDISSPTSVLALPENHVGESPDKLVSLTSSRRGHAPKSSSESAATTQGTFGEDDDDTAMLNGVLGRKRRPRTHFRGCVRFLLE